MECKRFFIGMYNTPGLDNPGSYMYIVRSLQAYTVGVYCFPAAVVADFFFCEGSGALFLSFPPECVLVII